MLFLQLLLPISLVVSNILPEYGTLVLARLAAVARRTKPIHIEYNVILQWLRCEMISLGKEVEEEEEHKMDRIKAC